MRKLNIFESIWTTHYVLIYSYKTILLPSFGSVDEVDTESVSLLLEKVTSCFFSGPLFKKLLDVPRMFYIRHEIHLQFF